VKWRRCLVILHLSSSICIEFFQSVAVILSGGDNFLLSNRNITTEIAGGVSPEFHRGFIGRKGAFIRILIGRLDGKVANCPSAADYFSPFPPKPPFYFFRFVLRYNIAMSAKISDCGQGEGEQMRFAFLTA